MRTDNLIMARLWLKKLLAQLNWFFNHIRGGGKNNHSKQLTDRGIFNLMIKRKRKFFNNDTADSFGNFLKTH